MSAVAATKPGFEAPTALPTTIRITITSTDVKKAERVCRDLLQKIKTRDSIAFKGPMRMPTKVLRLTTRKTPNGQGSKTWDKFEMRIHKRVIDITATITEARTVTNVNIESGVNVEVTVPKTTA
ncbi:30S ribosomal protein S10p/S20e [Fonticula alba]|uniref:Small ribosomal subunit protein uS10 n=1 Tax=Fonticula alba TaxID=691883 RepID=A0A058ZG45_FONAL|nr:30S ribosomal protein S10p/S20e [Fonticula alba]KCV72898.1 30S ribosomal protein S10p/S20e [Fonticula alba]|eukprot:XP_009492599.1 30S ribosomal protein S10p/S20e [Fonticula alba]